MFAIVFFTSFTSNMKLEAAVIFIPLSPEDSFEWIPDSSGRERTKRDARTSVRDLVHVMNLWSRKFQELVPGMLSGLFNAYSARDNQNSLKGTKLVDYVPAFEHFQYYLSTKSYVALTYSYPFKISPLYLYNFELESS